MPVLENIGLLAVCPNNRDQADIGAIERAALVWTQDKIAWVGRQGDLPTKFRGEDRIDARGMLVVPGLVDCHTHLAFSGWRADEFEQRIRGASYLDIARRGGGILRTVSSTRSADEGELTALCQQRLRQMARLGVTTVECKSGYGLDLENELKILNVYRKLQRTQGLRIVSTFLGAHTVPGEFSGNRESYLQLLVEKMIPEVAAQGLAEFCDVFVEEGAFSIREARQILECGRRHGLRPKLHADQLSDSGAALLAGETGAISADHLEFVSTEGIRALAESQVVAVALPLASLYLHQSPMPAREMIAQGVRVAVATDFNPGSAPSYHLPLAMMLACTMLRMTPAEVLKGATIYAASAIGREGVTGSLKPGKSADFVILDSPPNINHWLYHFRDSVCSAAYCKGKQVA